MTSNAIVDRLGLRSQAIDCSSRRCFSSSGISSARRFSPGMVRLAVWCDSPEAIDSGAELFTSIPLNETQELARTEHFRRIQLDESTLVDLIAPPAILRRRRLFLRKHGGARLVQVGVGEEVPEATEAVEAMAEVLKATNMVFQDTPKVMPKVSIGDFTSSLNSSTSAFNDNGQVFLREVVVGAGEDHEAFERTLQVLADSPSVESAGPLLFRVKNSRTILRILPSTFSAVVFSVPELDEVKEKQHGRRSFVGRVGATGSHRGQIHVSSRVPQHLRGLDIRLCAERGAPMMMFAESNEATLDNAVEMPQLDHEMSCRGRTALEGRWRISQLWANLGRAR